MTQSGAREHDADACSALSLRPVSEADSALLLRWRNDPVAVEFSATRRSVESGEHEAWFRSARASETTWIWIGEVDDEPVGQVRIEVGDGEAEVHISIAPEMRGRGHGTRLLAAARRRCAERGIRSLVARVDRRNAASLRMFETCGFVAAGGDAGLARLSWRL